MPQTFLKHVDGRPVTRVNAALIPLDRGPFPMPPHVRVAFLYTLQPSGTLANQPLTVTFPNPANLAPNTRITLWAHDPRKGGWYSPGQATVTEDGQQIKPDPGVQVTRFSCLGGAPADDTLRLCPEGGCAVAGLGVDVTSGVYTHRLPLFRQAGVPPLDLGIVYRSASASTGWFGNGTKPDVDIILGTWGAGVYKIVLPNNYHLTLSLGTPYTGDPVFYGAVLTNPGSPYPWKFTHKDGTVWWFDDWSGYLQAIDDRNGNRLTLTREATWGGLKTLALPDGRTLFVDSQSGPGIQAISAALDQAYRFTIVGTPDGKYELRTIADPLGQQTTFTYDSNHNLLTWTNPRCITLLTNQYDANQRVTRQTLADGAVWQYAYTVAGGIVTQTVVTDPRGNPTTYAISPTGYITAVTNALGQTTTFTRGGGNAITQVVDPLGRTTVLGYGANLNVTSVTRYLDPPTNTQPVTWAFTYGVNSQLSSVTDPLGHTTTYGLDAKGNLTTTTDPLNHSTTITRNALGQPTTLTDPLNNATTIGYNSFNLPASTTDPLGNITSQTYDLLGRQITQTDPRGFTSRFSYDLLNRPTSTADPLGAGVRLEYDPNGNVTKVTDALNNAITYTYNNMDRMSVR